MAFSEELFKEVVRNFPEQIGYFLLGPLFRFARLHKDGGAKERNRH